MFARSRVPKLCPACLTAVGVCLALVVEMVQDGQTCGVAGELLFGVGVGGSCAAGQAGRAVRNITGAS